jgi:hypothetical protein
LTIEVSAYMASHGCTVRAAKSDNIQDNVAATRRAPRNYAINNLRGAGLCQRSIGLSAPPSRASPANVAAHGCFGIRERLFRLSLTIWKSEPRSTRSWSGSICPANRWLPSSNLPRAALTHRQPNLQPQCSMLILFDNGTPAPLRSALKEHVVVEAFERGWHRLLNGDLISAAEAEGLTFCRLRAQMIRSYFEARGFSWSSADVASQRAR